jgi:hypothetical protein
MDMIVEASYAVPVPFGWNRQQTNQWDIAYLSPDSTQQMVIENVPMASTGLTSAAYEQQVLSTFEQKFGAKPETTETTVLGKDSVTLRIYHITISSQHWYALFIITARNGVGTMLSWTSIAGNEAADRALFDAISAGFLEMGFP